MRQLEEENRVLRERVAQLERALARGTDPILCALGQHADSYLTVVTPQGRFLATARPSEGFGSVVGRSVFEFVDEPSVEVMRNAFARVVESRRPQSYESVGYGEDGSPNHTYLTRAVPMIENDEVRAIVLVPTDISERVRLERSLVEKEESLRFALAASRMGLWRWDMVSGEIEWSERLLQICGLQQPPQNYQGYLALVHPDDRASVEQMTAEALRSGVYQSSEHRLIPRHGGGTLWVLASGTVLKDSRGQAVGLMGGAFDITEQKQLALQHQRAARVESIGQLTAGIAHNFNNLLAVIVPSLELQLSAMPESERAGLCDALGAALQARDLVRNLLSLTHRDAARPAASADPCEVVARVLSICRTTFPREIGLRQIAPSDLGLVSMSTSDLEQVLLNLLFNARDALEHSTKPEREIEVCASRVEQAGEAKVALRITDTGDGMSAEVRGRLFEPFFTTKPPHQGSGLGLANALERVRQAGGTLECESGPERGTTFTILLPSRPRPLPAAPASAPVIASTRVHATLLLVDDEPQVRKVVARFLEGEGYRVLQASNAGEAREVLRRGERVDLVILDQSMPRETGTQAFPSLRALTAAPVLLFTGMAPVLPEGMDGLLEKPARLEELHRVVRETLRKVERRS